MMVVITSIRDAFNGGSVTDLVGKGAVLNGLARLNPQYGRTAAKAIVALGADKVIALYR